MKTPLKIITFVSIVSLAAASVVYSGYIGNCSGIQNNGSYGSSVAGVSTLPYVMPDENEINGLIQMREEEKLARDVYATLSETWDDNIVFARISLSEQRHMDSVKSILDKYGIADPVVDDTRGIFQNSNLQDLYSNLVASGSTSLVDAMLVGATIEDLDIYDLYELITSTDNEDILVVYQNLAKGSRNHLRSFASELASMNVTYIAQYLSQEEVDLIISSAFERGRYDQDGKAMFTAPRGNGSARGAGRMSGGSNFVDENGNGICDLME